MWMCVVEVNKILVSYLLCLQITCWQQHQIPSCAAVQWTEPTTGIVNNSNILDYNYVVGLHVETIVF